MKALKQIGILSGIALVGAAAIIPFTTSCKKKENPVVTPEIIDQATFDDNEQYQVSESTRIYTTSSNSNNSHNVFLDLNKFSADNNNATEFHISGTVNFGILVGFNENVNLYGENGSLINLTGQTGKTYGILVGSTESGSDTYAGNIYIDKSISANIASSASGGFSSGVWIDSTASGSTTINGSFSVSSSGNSSGAYGVWIRSTTAGSTTINGNFLVSSESDAGGVWIESTANGSTTINGNFSIFSVYTSAYGVRFSYTAWGSTQNINGNFSVSSSSTSGITYACGVYFFSADDGSTQDINGNFSVSSANAKAYGVRFDSSVDGPTQNINGNFSVYGGVNTYGVCYSYAPTNTRSGTPAFYSNKADSGNWISNSGTETWNGGSDGTTIDAAFALTQIYDTPTNVSTDSHFSFLTISSASTAGSKTTFDNLLINAFQNLSDCYVAWSVLTTNIRNILITMTINQATFDNNEQYQVSGDVSINTSSTSSIDSHNVLFDLKKFSDDNNNATYFIIDGAINFGILVGFDEDVSLYGENGSLINLINQTQNTYGILVGSSDSGSDTYTGNMYIDNSVTANISAPAEGDVRFNPTGVSDYRNSAYGVYFGTSTAGAITIDGNFSVYSSSGSSGVYFDSAVGGSMAINGNFSISGLGNSYGVYFDSTSPNSILNINGNFSVSSDDADASGVRSYSTAAGSTLNVNGNFSLIALYSEPVYGVYFESTVPGTCSGTPTFYSNKADSGNWIGGGRTETWNGGSDGTTTDATFALARVYDTPTNVQTDSHFYFLVISAATRAESKATFDHVLINTFQNLSDGYVTWSTLTDNIRSLFQIILNQATFDNNPGYQISESTSIYSSLTGTIGSHNLFFDLNKFSADNNNATSFIIDGTINFGILVGFHENVNLYGENGSLINLAGQTNATYGILVGSTVSGSDTYTGNMYIDESVNVYISSVSEWLSIITSYGVGIACPVVGQVMINGNFSIYCETEYKVCIGVWFGSTVSGLVAIGGNFWVFSYNYSAYGVWFSSAVSGSVSIDGNFQLEAGGTPARSEGVHFDDVTTADSSVTINGNFSMRVTYENVQELFSCGVWFDKVVRGEVSIDGNFAIAYATGNRTSIAGIEGVRLNDAVSGTVTINGNFALSFDTDGAFTVKGVAFGSSDIGTNSIKGSPWFCSNKTDSGDWSKSGLGGRTEIWNGVQTTVGATYTTTADATFALTQVYDTPTNVQTDSHFSFLAISAASTAGSKTTFDNLLINAFENLNDGYVAWSILTTNIRNLLS